MLLLEFSQLLSRLIPYAVITHTIAILAGFKRFSAEKQCPQLIFLLFRIQSIVGQINKVRANAALI